MKYLYACFPFFANFQTLAILVFLDSEETFTRERMVYKCVKF